MTHCSKPVLVDSRPGDHTPATVGQDCEPWLVRDAVHFLHYLLVDPESTNGLEWGSGSSSFWLVTRLRSLISIENDPSWFEYVAGYFRSAGKDLIETQGTAEDGTSQKRWKGYLFQSTEKGDTQYKGSDNRFHEEYVQFGNEAQPWDSSENYFDYVSVDGRARNAGMKVAIKRIRQDGGILILDNSERERYSLGKSYVPSHWKKFEFHSDNYGSTTI
ncbi:hypothetical protein MP638_002412 [Amoeboaphelidium occidentale]|nr:hypothetical protein MP638_002412 [Amoeboaphelidium occidentale]